MEWNWAAIAAIAAVVIIPVTIWAVLRRQRRPVVVLLATKTRVGLAATSDLLGMTWDGVPIADPWLVTLTVVNESRDDIASARFDRARPLVLSLGTAEVKDTLSVPFDGEPWSLPADGSRGAVKFRPYLIKAGARLQIQFVVSEEPALKWCSAHLINVDIRHRLTGSGTPRWAPLLAVGGISALVSLALIVLAMIWTSQSGAFSAAAIAAAAVSIVASLFALATLWSSYRGLFSGHTEG